MRKFNQWKENKESLGSIPIYLDEDFIRSIQKCISICEDRMKELDPEGYKQYVDDLKKEQERQTKLAFGDKK